MYSAMIRALATLQRFAALDRGLKGRFAGVIEILGQVRQVVQFEMRRGGGRKAHGYSSVLTLIRTQARMPGFRQRWNSLPRRRGKARDAFCAGDEAELLALAKLVTVCCIGAVCESRARSVITEPYAAWKISIQFTGAM